MLWKDILLWQQITEPSRFIASRHFGFLSGVQQIKSTCCNIFLRCLRVQAQIAFRQRSVFFRYHPPAIRHIPIRRGDIYNIGAVQIIHADPILTAICSAIKVEGYVDFFLCKRFFANTIFFRYRFHGNLLCHFYGNVVFFRHDIDEKTDFLHFHERRIQRGLFFKRKIIHFLYILPSVHMLPVERNDTCQLFRAPCG